MDGAKRIQKLLDLDPLELTYETVLVKTDYAVMVEYEDKAKKKHLLGDVHNEEGTWTTEQRGVAEEIVRMLTKQNEELQGSTSYRVVELREWVNVSKISG